MRHVAAISVLVFAFACSTGDRIRVAFVNEADRDQTVRIEVFAVQPTRPSGEKLDCQHLNSRDGVREIVALVEESSQDDVDLSYAQRTQVPLPTPPGQNPLLVQVPQQGYLFFALALDAFGFAVARGCEWAEVNARQNLDLAIEMATLPGEQGRLELIGPQQWLQHAGAAGTEAAPRLAVRVLDDHGSAVENSEVRLRVVSGQAVPLNERMLTGSDGVAQTEILAHVGRSVIDVHVRGLTDSPWRVQLDGLPSPSYQVETHDLSGQPLGLIVGNYHFDAFSSDDFLIVHRDNDQSYRSIWFANLLTPVWEAANWDVLGVDVAQTVGGLFDRDDRPDFAVVTAETPPSLLMFHHRINRADSFNDPIVESVPADVDSIIQIHTANVDGLGADDLIALVQSSSGVEILVYSSRDVGASDRTRVLFLQQRFSVPDFASDGRVDVGDLDGDGDDEILLVSFISGIWIIPCGDANGAGAGRYYTPVQAGGRDWPHLFSSIGQSYVVTGEVTGDSYADVVVVNNANVVSGNVAWQLAMGDGTLDGYQLGPRVPIPIYGLEQVLLADINADGNMDLLVRSNTPPARISLMGGDGLGRFASPIFLDLGMSAVDMGVADLDLDGVNDIGLIGRTVDGSFVQGHISAGLVN